MASQVRPFQYRISQLGLRSMPGTHRSEMTGFGQLFKRHDSLLANPDPRRLDLRASVLNPFKEYRVKVYEQASRISVFVIADLSRSMSYSGSFCKQQIVSDFVKSAAYSAHQAGDLFKFIGCGIDLDPQGLRMAQKDYGAISNLVDSLSSRKLMGKAESMMKARSILPNQRALIFIVSDFHFPLSRLQVLLSQLSGYVVVPVVLWDETEYSTLPNWGIWKAKDLESGSRTFLLRPSYKQRIVAAFRQRKRALQQIFRQFDAEPLFIDGEFQSESVTAYFYGRAV
ncbi:MAG: MxaS protein [Methylococcaceae bacterium]|nr:MxaS protein [Methylococcaceae bacterium]